MKIASPSKTLCLVFDLDDTLFVEQDYVRSGFSAVGQWAHRALGIRGFAETAWEIFQEGQRGSVFDEALRRHGRATAGSHIARMVRLYREHSPQIRLAEDAAWCLEFFRERACLALISDGPLSSQSRKVEALGLARLMRPLVLTAHWGPNFGKPRPAAYEYVVSRHCNPQIQFVYVGDNPAKDFQAPRALGWTTVRVRRAGGLHAKDCASPAESADWEIESLEGLPRVLGLSARD